MAAVRTAICQPSNNLMSGHNFTRVFVPPRKLVIITAPSGAGKSSIVEKTFTAQSKFIVLRFVHHAR